MPYTADIFSSSIVALGNFNAAIFSPDWFEKNKLIGSEDAESARAGQFAGNLVVSHEVSVFETKWFALQVIQNQLSLTSKDALSPAFRDLAVGMLQLVPHTPTKAIGLNFHAHFKLSDEAAYHKVGDTLAPKDIWNSLYPDYSAGMADVTIKIQKWKRGEPPKTKDEIRIAVQPSAKIKFGAFLSYNDHHELESNQDDGKGPAERAAKVVDEFWEPAWQDSMRVFDGILAKVLGAKA